MASTQPHFTEEDLRACSQLDDNGFEELTGFDPDLIAIEQELGCLDTFEAPEAINW